MKIFWLFVLLLAAVLAVVGAQIGPELIDSYVLIRIFGYAIETSALWLVTGLFIAFVGLHVLLWLWHLPSNALRKHFERRAQAQLEIGMMALTEGDFKKAEKALAKSAQTTNRPAINYVAAAQAAQAKGDTAKRDEYLAKAEESADNADPVIVSKAQLLLRARQPEAALTLLQGVKSPNKPRVLNMIARCHEAIGNWVELDEMAPKLVKAGLIDQSRADLFALQADHLKLSAANDAGQLQDAWQALPRHHRKRPEILTDYAVQAVKLGATDGLEKELRNAINRQWSDELLQVYGQLPAEDTTTRLKSAEKWLKAHPDNPVLHLTIARLARNAGDSAKARQHYRSSYDNGPNAEAAAELAEVLAAEGYRDEALSFYAQAVTLFGGGEPEAAPELLNDERVIDALPPAPKQD